MLRYDSFLSRGAGLGAGEEGGDPPVYVGGRTHAFGGTTGTTSISLSGTLTGGLDTSPAEGDIVIVAVGIGSSGNVDVTLSTADYIEVADLYGNDSNDANLGVYYKIMGPTPDTEVVIGSTGDAQNGCAVGIHVWRGVNQTTPMDVTAVPATGINTNRANPPAITPVTSGAVVVSMGSGCATNAAVYTSSDLDNFRTAAVNDTFDAVVGIGSIEWGGSGEVDPAQFGGGDGSTTMAWCAVTLALRPD